MNVMMMMMMMMTLSGYMSVPFVLWQAKTGRSVKTFSNIAMIISMDSL
jgi:hypothetical protein